jgi:hypothetical protein
MAPHWTGPRSVISVSRTQPKQFDLSARCPLPSPSPISWSHSKPSKKKTGATPHSATRYADRRRPGGRRTSAPSSRGRSSGRGSDRGAFFDMCSDPEVLHEAKDSGRRAPPERRLRILECATRAGGLGSRDIDAHPRGTSDNF